jgi:hypothetical protein
MIQKKEKATPARAAQNEITQSKQYHNRFAMSNKIDLLLGNLLIALECLSAPREGATVLYAIDGLLRLKIDITHREGVDCG